jgi:hypothetical protein
MSVIAAAAAAAAGVTTKMTLGGMPTPPPTEEDGGRTEEASESQQGLIKGGEDTKTSIIPSSPVAILGINHDGNSVRSMDTLMSNGL